MSETSDSDDLETHPTAHTNGDRIIAKVNDGVVEGDWETMKQFAETILDEVDQHKPVAQKIKEISGAHLRISCSNCEYEDEFKRVRDYRNRGRSPEQHAAEPHNECGADDVELEAFCPRHGRIPLEYNECDECAANREAMHP